MSTCIFCFRPAPVTIPWCADNPGKGCTYGMNHEFPEPEKPVQPKRVDSALCSSCGLHPKNPAYDAAYKSGTCRHGIIC